MPTEANTTTKEDREPLCNAPCWPRNGLGERHKPISILLSYAGKHKHLGRDASAGEHIHMAIRVILQRTLERIEKISTGPAFAAVGTAAELAAVELAICVLENTEPHELSAAQQAWERKERAR